MITEQEALKCLPAKGWLRDYVEFAMARTDACASYHIAGGLAALTSAGVGLIRFGGIKVLPSAYFLLVGPSSQSRKTAAINIASEIVSEADPTATCEKVASKEALVGFLHKQPKRLLVYEEFGAFLAAAERGPLLAMKTALNDCLDYETEILTAAGWRGPGEVKQGDLVYSLNRDTNLLELMPVTRVVDREVAPTERMLVVKNQRYNLRVTEGHQIHLKYADPANHGRPSQRYITEAGRDFAQRRGTFYLPRAAPPAQEFPGVPLTDDELRLVAWHMTDGSITGSRFTISQTKIPTRDHIRGLLTRLGLDFTETASMPSRGAYPGAKPKTVFGIPAGTHKGLKRNGWSKYAAWFSKDVSPLLHQMTKQQFEVFWAELLLGDGSNRSNGGRNWLECSRKTKADNLSHMAIARGFSATISTYQTKNGLTMYRLNIHERQYLQTQFGNPRTGCQPQLVPAEKGERVWCVTNQNSTIVTRRGGRIVILGNCHDGSSLGNALAKETREGKNKGQITNALVSILAGSAPHYLERHTESVDWTDGFFARFFIIHAQRERTFRAPTDDPARRAYLIDGLKRKIYDAMERQLSPPTFRGLSEDAKELWYDWFDQLAKREEAARFSAAITRAPSFALRIATLLALDYGGILEATDWEIGVNELAPAIAITELHIKSTCSLGQYIAESPDMARRRSVLQAIDSTPTPLSSIIARSRLLLRDVQGLLSSLLAEHCVERCPAPDSEFEMADEQHYQRTVELNDIYTPPELPSWVWDQRPLVAPIETLPKTRQVKAPR